LINKGLSLYSLRIEWGQVLLFPYSRVELNDMVSLKLKIFILHGKENSGFIKIKALLLSAFINKDTCN